MSYVKFIFAVLSVSGSGFPHGFHIAFINLLFQELDTWYRRISEERLGAGKIKEDYDFTMLHLIATVAFSIGGIVGSLFIWPAASLLGRKLSLLCCNGVILFAVVLISYSNASDTFELLMFGRLLMGVCAGLTSGISPMYLIEISPFCHRGTAGSAYYVMVALAICVTFIFTHPRTMGTGPLWGYLVVFSCFPTIIQSIMLFFCPESPKHLFLDKDDEDGAEDALAWIEGDQIDDEMEELREEQNVLNEIGPVTFLRLFTDETLRTPLIISTVIMVGQQTTGINVVLYSSSFFLGRMKYDSELAYKFAIGLSVANVISSFISMILVDRIGRKRLLLISFVGMVLSMFCFTLTLTLLSLSEEVKDRSKIIAALFLVLYIFMFGIGTGTISWFITAEFANQFARPMMVTITVTLNWIVHLLLVGSFVPLWVYLASYSFVVFGVLDLLVLIFIALTMRETNNLSFVDIIELFYD